MSGIDGNSPESNIWGLDDSFNVNWDKVEAVELDLPSNVGSIKPEEIIAGTVQGTAADNPLEERKAKVYVIVVSTRQSLEDSLDQEYFDKIYRDLPQSKEFSGELLTVINGLNYSKKNANEKLLELNKIQTTFINFALIQRTEKDIKNFGEKLSDFRKNFDTYFPVGKTSFINQFEKNLDEMIDKVSRLLQEAHVKPGMSEDIDLEDKPIVRVDQKSGRAGRSGRGSSVSKKSEKEIEKKEGELRSEEEKPKLGEGLGIISEGRRRSTTRDLAARVSSSITDIFLSKKP